MTPKALELMLVFGTPNWTRLNALKASSRNCTRNLSVMLVFLNSDISKLATPGLRRFGIRRGALPKVNGALKENTEVSKYRKRRGALGPLSVASLPLQLGRCVPAKLP